MAKTGRKQNISKTELNKIASRHTNIPYNSMKSLLLLLCFHSICIWLATKLILALASIVILGFESHIP
jgi:hypothetical protein